MTPADAAHSPAMAFDVLRDAEGDTLALDAVFANFWPAYQKWMARARGRLTAQESRARLHEHMPELTPIFDELLERFGGKAPIARFLSLYKPPALVRGCTQAIWQGEDGPALVRNYDHAPHLADGVVLHADWGGMRTLCMSDCIWGALDGINEHGLCVALAFGGRPTTGDGFASPLLVRYVLQTCTTTDEAAEALGRLPCAMTYTFACLDARGEHATAYLAPDRPARIDRAVASANHQGKVEWPQYAQSCKTVERLKQARALLEQPGQTLEGLIDAFLKAPIYRTAYSKGSGTLYTSVYTPGDLGQDLRWPADRLHQFVGRYEPARVHTQLGLAD